MAADTLLIDRRQFLAGVAAFGLLGHRPVRAGSWRGGTARVASNQAVENATLQHLMADGAFASEFRLDLQVVPSKDVAGPLADLVAGRADVCMLSAFAGVLPAIAKGAPVRLVGTAMQIPAIAVYTARPDLRTVAGLRGCTIGIGPKNGLLHLLMIALLRKNGIDPEQVRFVSIGSNAEVLRAVAGGVVDAGPSGVAGLSMPNRVHVLSGGHLWQDLREFTYQPAYASVEALAHRAEAVARCLAAYTRMFRFLSAPHSQAAYLSARDKAGGDLTEGQRIWEFIQEHRPYPPFPGITASQIDYLQELNASMGLQQEVLPFQDVADPAPAERARHLLATHSAR